MPPHRDLRSINAGLRAQLAEQRDELARLSVENEVLREAAAQLLHLAPARERFAFIHARRELYSIKKLCTILVTDRAGYYRWSRTNAQRARREAEEKDLTERILEIHATWPAYGAERITRELQRQEIAVGRRRVARIMREHGIRVESTRFMPPLAAS